MIGLASSAKVLSARCCLSTHSSVIVIFGESIAPLGPALAAVTHTLDSCFAVAGRHYCIHVIVSVTTCMHVQAYMNT